MIICLGDELLQYVPVAVSLLLSDCKVCNITVLLLQQLILYILVTGYSRVYSFYKPANNKVQRKDITVSSNCFYASCAGNNDLLKPAI
jgi:hypothetical protein